MNVKFLYLNALKRNLDIAFLRYSRDYVTSVIVVTGFDCISVLMKLIQRSTSQISDFSEAFSFTAVFDSSPCSLR
jgi:hypothetical protein